MADEQTPRFEVDPSNLDTWYLGQGNQDRGPGLATRRLTLFEKGTGTELAQLYFYEPNVTIPRDFQDPVSGGPGIVMDLPVDAFDGVISLLQSSAKDGRPVSLLFRTDVESAILTNAPAPSAADVR